MSPVAGSGPATPCRFTQAGDTDGFILDAWLPRDRHRGVSFVGRVGSDASPVAAFAVAPPIERYDPQGLAVALHVQPTCRGRGIEQNIIALAQRMAASESLGPLHAWPSPVEGSDEHAVFAALGFEPFDHLTTWEMSAVAAHDTLRSLRDRLIGHRPHHPAWLARDISLSDADAAQVLELFERELMQTGALREEYVNRLHGRGDQAYDLRLSRVLVRDGRTLGFLLVRRWPGDLFEIQARVMAPHLRDGVGNLRLMLAPFDAEPPPPHRMVRFHARDKHQGTHGLARRLAARQVEVRVSMRLG